MSSFSVSLKTLHTAELRADTEAGREIWLRSTEPISENKLPKIQLCNPLGSLKYNKGEDLTFVLVITQSDINLEYQFPEVAKTKDDVYGTTTLRFDENTPLLWAGNTGDVIPDQTDHFIEFRPESPIYSQLQKGDYLFVLIRSRTAFAATGEAQPIDEIQGMKQSDPFAYSSLNPFSKKGEDDDHIPLSPPASKNDRIRHVKIGFRKTGLGPYFYQNLYPTTPMKWQHWAVVCGEWYHELSGSGIKEMWYYNNQMTNQKELKVVYAGYTKYNDRAIADAAKEVMNEFGEWYNPVSNNCQKWALNLLDKICFVGRVKFTTQYAPAAQVLPGKRYVHTEPEEPKKVYGTHVYDDLWMTRIGIVGEKITTKVVDLGEEEKQELLQRAEKIMYGKTDFESIEWEESLRLDQWFEKRLVEDK